MKSVVAFSSLAVAVLANANHEAKVHLFEGAACGGKVIAKHHMKMGHCQKLDHTLKVDTPQLKEDYHYMSLSGDDFSEVYLFGNKEECKEYGTDFDQNKVVTFIRAPGRDICYECNHCGTAKSVRFDTVKEHDHKHDDKPKAEEKPEDVDVNAANDDGGSAAGLVVSSLVVLASSVASIVF